MKNILLVLFFVIAVGEGAFILYRKFGSSHKMMPAPSASPSMAPENKPPRPMMLSKGMKLDDSSIKQYAFLVAPGDISDDSKKALVGFAITSQKQADGSLLVTFAPKDSDDQRQEYTVKTGQKLYFIEMTPVDDKADSDKDLNYRDDYGIIVDQDGVVQ